MASPISYLAVIGFCWTTYWVSHILFLCRACFRSRP